MKGKGVDPHNWGDAQFSESDVDVEAQCVALESFAIKRNKALEHVSSDEEQSKEIKTAHLREKGSSRTPSRKTLDRVSVVPTPKVDAKRKAQLVKAARTNVPINQIVPKSYLGRALDKIKKSEKSSRHCCRRCSSSPDTSGSDSSPSSSSSETSGNSENDSQIAQLIAVRHKGALGTGPNNATTAGIDLNLRNLKPY